MNQQLWTLGHRSRDDILRSLFTILVASLLSMLAWAEGNAEESAKMPASEFVKQYEAALATQKWEAVSPMIHKDARVVFSDGSVHRGKDAVRTGYERNFDMIKNEKYRITNVHWLLDSSDSAAYMFDFFWTGSIEGQEASGAGRGTAVLVLEDDQWKLLGEHLGPYPRQ